VTKVFQSRHSQGTQQEKTSEHNMQSGPGGI
jgi:hypothetical protein